MGEPEKSAGPDLAAGGGVSPRSCAQDSLASWNTLGAAKPGARAPTARSATSDPSASWRMVSPE
eukprot:7327603-Lingulodinium_polyedra.AAC.1